MFTRDAFTVGLIQMSMGEDPAANLQQALAHVEDAAGRGADLICLPELFCSRYFCQEEDARFFDLSEPIPGPTTQALAEVAKKHAVTIVASLFEKRAPGLFHNTVAVIGPDGDLLGTYRKMHIPDDPHYYEKFYFTPGDLGFRAIETPVGKVGVLVCWDQWYPEAARLTAMAGADILLYPTAIGWHPAEKAEFGSAQREAWQTMQRAHAIANGLPVVAVNRAGFEPRNADGDGIDFWGSSFAAGPFGEILTEAPAGQEAVLLQTMDPAQSETVRRHWPFFRDRRIDHYDGLRQRWLDGGQA